MRNKEIKGFASPLRYPGGKTRLASFLAKAVDENFGAGERITLVEPYAGGAGASLALLFAGRVNEIIINDLDNAIYTFWKVTILDTDYLIRRIKRIDITIDEWRKQKRIYKTSSNEYSLAFATLFLNRTNRSGIMYGNPIGGIGQSGKWRMDARFTKETIIGRLEKIKEYKNKIKVFKLDGIKLLKRLEQHKRVKDYFVFLDPPYYQKGKSLYLNHYNNKDHQKLADFLNTSSLKWITTYDNIPYIKKLYSGRQTNEFSIHHNAYESRVGKEIMVFSDNLNFVRM